MTRPCPGPRATTSRPNWQPPPDSTDCHCHIFGPYDRYPLSPGRSYTPPEASISRYLEMLETIGLRTALVKDGVMHVQAGAGVVADSDPQAEYEETRQKARALFRAAEEAVRFAAGRKA